MITKTRQNITFVINLKDQQKIKKGTGKKKKEFGTCFDVRAFDVNGTLQRPEPEAKDPPSS